MQATPTARVGLKTPAQSKVLHVRPCKPSVGVVRGAVQTHAAPLYQLADASGVAVEAGVDSPVSITSEAVAAVAGVVSDAGAAASAAVQAAATSAPSLAAQRYAEMTSRAPKMVQGGGSGISFQAPSFSMPKISVPELPKLSAPDLSKISVPELPKLPTAGLGDGAVSLPKLDLDLEVPKFDLPDVGGAASTVGAAAADAAASAAAAAASVSAAVGGAVSDVTSVVGSTVSEVTTTVGGALTSAAATVSSATGAFVGELDRELTAARGAVQGAVTAVDAAVSSAVSTAEVAVGDTVAQVYGSLPPQGQLIATDLGDVASAFTSHPTSTLVLAGLVGVPLGVKGYLDRFGGYSGDLSPAAVKALLSRGEGVVVDVRTEAERQASGVLELRKGARYNAAALPADTVLFPPKWAKESKAGSRLQVTTTALLVSQLNRIRTPLTKVVIMNDKDDVAARELARAVRDAGVLRVYVMAGGFQAWSAAGLGVVPNKTEYDASALAVLGDEIVDFATTVGSKLRDPAFLATTLATSSLLAYATLNYHTTLRYFAVWGVFASIYWRLSRYESPQALLEEVKGGVVAAASSAASSATSAAAAAAATAASKASELVAPPAPAPAMAAAAAAAAPAATAAPPPPPTAPATVTPPAPPKEASAAALAAAMAAAGVIPVPVAAPLSPPVSDTTTSAPMAAAAMPAGGPKPVVSAPGNGNGGSKGLNGTVKPKSPEAGEAVKVPVSVAATSAAGGEEQKERQ